MKTKLERIENDAYMILQGLAFGFAQNGTVNEVVAINLKNLDQVVHFRQRNTDLLLGESSMSKENTYKAMIIAERNKERLVEGLNTWANTQGKK